MKKTAFIMILLFVSCFIFSNQKISASEITPEINLGFQIYMPSDDDSYDSGFGAEIQARFWQNRHFGLGLSAGLSSWLVNDTKADLSDNTAIISYDADGSVIMLPIGGSMFLRAFPNDNLMLLFEGGVRYVFVESNADISVEYTDIYGRYIRADQEIEIDDGIIGITSFSAKNAITEKFKIIGTLGYQFDIHKGDAKWLGEDMGENELESFFISAGFELGF